MTCSARLPVYALLIGAFVPARDGARAARRSRASCCSALYLLGGVVGARGRRRCSKRTLLPRHGAAVLPRAAALPHADREALAVAGVGQRAGVPAPRGHDHPRRVDRALGAAALPAQRAAARRDAEAQAARQRSSTASRGTHRPRDRARDRAARLRLEDRRRPAREPRRARGDRRDARADLRRRATTTTARCATRSAPTSTRAPGAPVFTPADRRRAARLLRLRAAVHVDARGDARARPNCWRWPALRLRLPARRSPTARASSRTTRAARCCRDAHRQHPHRRVSSPAVLLVGTSIAPRLGAGAAWRPATSRALPASPRAASRRCGRRRRARAWSSAATARAPTRGTASPSCGALRQRATRIRYPWWCRSSAARR